MGKWFIAYGTNPSDTEPEGFIADGNTLEDAIAEYAEYNGYCAEDMTNLAVVETSQFTFISTKEKIEVEVVRRPEKPWKGVSSTPGYTD